MEKIIYIVVGYNDLICEHWIVCARFDSDAAEDAMADAYHAAEDSDHVSFHIEETTIT